MKHVIKLSLPPGRIDPAANKFFSPTKLEILNKEQRCTVENIREVNDDADDQVNELLSIIDNLTEQFAAALRYQAITKEKQQ